MEVSKCVVLPCRCLGGKTGSVAAHAQFLNDAPAVVDFCVSDSFIKVVVILIAANSSDGVRNLIDTARGIAP